MQSVIVPSGRQEPLRFPPTETKGVVYTKAWVVDLILDLVGYTADKDLSVLRAVEPAAGDGAFLIPMLRRLLASLAGRRKRLSDANGAILAYELDNDAADTARAAVRATLREHGVSPSESRRFAARTVVCRDYLLDPQKLSGLADVVVGNPPYIRYDDIPAELLAEYKANYSTMVGRGDLYVGFIEAALRDLRPGGRLGFICADRWMRSAYGAALRDLVSQTCSVDYVVEMHKAPAFDDDVSAYPAITILTRGAQGTAIVASANEDAEPQTAGLPLADLLNQLADSSTNARLRGFRATRLAGWHTGSAPWPWAEPHELRLLRKLEQQCGPLEDPTTSTRVGIGVATGADSTFVTSDADLVESSRLLPLAMSQDTRTGTLKWSGHYLVNPWADDGSLVDLRDYPRLAQYFESSSDLLKRRNIAARQPDRWYRTIDKITPGLFETGKLYFPDMKAEASPVLDDGGTYPHHNLYYVTSQDWDLQVLGGLLLSRIAELFVSSYCVKMRGGTLRFQAQYLRRIRVPAPSTIPTDVQERLREAFRTRDRDLATTSACHAYGIEEEELLP